MTFLQPAKPINVPQAVQQALDLQRQGKFPQAEKLYSDILSVRPDYFEALHMLGLIKQQRGDLAGALRLMAAALQARPKSPEVLLNYSLVLNGLGRDQEALAVLDQVLAIKRRSVEAHNNRGTILDNLGRTEEALECFGRALDIKSAHPDALYNHGSVLRKLGRYEEALKSFNRLLVVRPDYAKAHNNRGAALESLGRNEEALASYEKALSLDPDFVEALSNRANRLVKFSRFDEALACYERALSINPRHAEVLYNRSSALSALGRHHEALESVAAAAVVNPNYVNAHWNESLLLLRLGDYAAGFEKYEWRWKREENAKHARNFPQPMWLGKTPLAGRTILIHHEQGFGDTIQFARYAKLLAEQGRVILEVQPPLKSLMSRTGPGIEVIGNGEPIPDFDVHCPLMSLPLAFHTAVNTIPADIPYLTVPDERIAAWSERLPPRQGLRVGVVWSGNPTHKDDHNRSIAFDRLSQLFDMPNVSFVSLQHELRDTDAALLASDSRVTDIGRHFDDFADTAAAVAGMDLVISVDTSVAHLAGALGKPVWVLLPLCPDWRWLIERDDSPWYPSARLFRQPAIGDWESVIGEVRAALIERAAG